MNKIIGLAFAAGVAGMFIPGAAAEMKSFIEQNFDSAEFAPGILKSNHDGDRPLGGCKDYTAPGGESGMEIVTAPVASAPHSLKIRRTKGGNFTLFRNSEVPSGHDYTISFKLFLPADGQVGMLFNGENDKLIGGIWLMAGKPLRAYRGTAREYAWRDADNLLVPGDKFVTVTIDFNAAIQRYRIGIDSGDGVKLSKVRFPALNQAALRNIRFIDSTPDGTYGIIDDISVRYDAAASLVPEDFDRSVFAATPAENQPPAWFGQGKVYSISVPADGKTAAGENVVYGVIHPFQISSRSVAAFVNRGVYTKKWNYDIEDGSDIIIFDRLDKFASGKVFPITRSGIEKFRGEDRVFNRFPAVGGFVPLGAVLKDGSPHPHAGTGFAISQVLHTPPRAEDRGFDYNSPAMGRQTEVVQLSYDGTNIKVSSPEAVSGALRIGDSGWFALTGGMTIPIPDGEDLIGAAWSENPADGSVACGIVRWKRIDGKWMQTQFTPVVFDDALNEHCAYEPSLVRTGDRELYFSVRDDGQPHFKWPTPAPEQNIYAWRSMDNGENWQLVLRCEKCRPPAPITINRTVDGKLFFLCNRLEPDRSGSRNHLMLMELNEANNRVSGIHTVCDARTTFGANAGGGWQIDHPNSAVLRLADGRERTVVAFRVRDNHFIPGTRETLSEPSSGVGSYLMDLGAGSGKPIPVWKFND